MEKIASKICSRKRFGIEKSYPDILLLLLLASAN